MAEAKDEAGGWALEGCTCPPLFDHRRFLHHIGCPLKDRDQALSAPTAESGKDSAPPGSDVTPNSGGPVHVQGVITTTGGGGAVEPVAEAPERVTSQQAFGIVLGLDGERFEILNRYIAQQEQSEREVAGLRESLDKYRNRKRELDQELASKLDDIEQLRTQLTAAERKAEGLRNECEDLRGGLELAEQALTDANLKAEGLRVDNEELAELMAKEHARAVSAAAKLAESERQAETLEGLARRGCFLWLHVYANGTPFVVLGDEPGARDKWAGKRHEGATVLAAIEAMVTTLPQAHRDAMRAPPASIEPAGVEAGKADPTPTETEAPARFRVGQRVLINSTVTTTRSGIVSDIDRYGLRIKGLGIWFGWHEVTSDEPEPAGPAPPKPRAAKLTGPVEAFRAELVAALRDLVPKAKDLTPAERFLFLAQSLDREGGGNV